MQEPSRQLHGASALFDRGFRQKMARAVAGARTDLNMVATTVVRIAPWLTRFSIDAIRRVGTSGACGLRVAQPLSAYDPRDSTSTILYGMVRDHFETFRAHAASLRDGDGLPRFVGQEFRDFLRCGCLAGGFARFRCAAWGQDLTNISYRLVPCHRECHRCRFGRHCFANRPRTRPPHCHCTPSCTRRP